MSYSKQVFHIVIMTDGGDATESSASNAERIEKALINVVNLFQANNNNGATDNRSGSVTIK